MTFPLIPEVVAHVGRLPVTERTGYLQTVFGPPTDDPVLLDRRAQLVTALNDARVWPHGCPGSGETVKGGKLSKRRRHAS